jgi:glutamyl-tRNA synthetase
MEFKYLTVSKQIKQKLDKFDKENKGQIVTRMPPEPSGYLHLGHAKALYINASVAKKYNGKLIIRMDDTNPSLESDEFEKAIFDDLKILGCDMKYVTYSSDHFDLLIKCAEQFIKDGVAYVDFTEITKMREMREAGKDTEYRNNSTEDNLTNWNKMKNGELTEGCVRLKIDMNHKNKAMRDFSIFRPINISHHRTGDKYKVYPTYDFSCPIVDSVEGITHVFRSDEFNERDEQYEFILKYLNMRIPELFHYGKVAIKGAEMSKRKIKKSIEDKIYSGYDDPRLYTIRGLFNRGLSIKALEEFMNITGYPPSTIELEPDNLWSINRKIIDKIATRYVVLSENIKALPIELGNNEDIHKLIDTKHINKFHRNLELGTKTIYYSKILLFDKNDIEEIKPGEEVTLMNYGNVFFKGDRMVTNTKGDIKKTSKKLLWLPFDNDYKNVKIIIKSYGSDNKCIINEYFGEPDMINIKTGDYVQFIKMNYYVCSKTNGTNFEFIEMN